MLLLMAGLALLSAACSLLPHPWSDVTVIGFVMGIVLNAVILLVNWNLG
jgi:hypothetical protein